MGARTNTRDRMITGAATLLAEKGLPGTTIAAVLERTGTPRGSVPHHFPGGRTELLREAILMVGAGVTDRLRTAEHRGASPAEIITLICNHYRDRLIATGYTAGCPVWAVVQDAAGFPELASTAAEVVDNWTGLIAGTLVPLGYAPASARTTASFILSSMEGALALSRLTRSTRPLDDAADTLSRIINGTAW